MPCDRKGLLTLFTLVLLLSCAKTEQQISPDKQQLPTLTADLVTQKGKASVVRITGGNLFTDRRNWLNIGAGSGFFVESDKVVTNMHVVSSPGIIFAKLSDNEAIWTVEGVTAFDIENDLVILQIAGEGMPLRLGNSGAVTKGETVYAIGYPGGGDYKLTEGIVWNSRYKDMWIQTTADTARGNSGGPILNDRGEVIGISSRFDDSYSYAIPSDALKVLLSQPAQSEPLVKWYQQKRIRAYTYYARGRKKYQDNDDRAAILELNKSIELDPEFAYAYRVRGYVMSHYGAAIGKYERNITKARRQHQAAIKNHTKAIELDSENDENYHGRGHARSQYGKYETEQANAAEAHKQYQAAIEDYTKAIKLDPNDSMNYSRRGQVKHRFGQSNMKQGEFSKARKQYQAAIKDYTKAIKLDPNDSSHYNGRGWTQYLLGQLKTEQGKVSEAQKHYYEAISDSDKALQLKIDNTSAYHTRGVAKAALAAYNGAIEDFNTAIEHNSGFTKAYESRGKAKEGLGHHKAAAIDFTRALQSLGHGTVSAQELEKAATEMVKIPAGEFQMGSKELMYATPIHTVYLDEFYIDPYEVTNAQFKAFIDANPEWSKENISSKYHNGNYLQLWNGNDYPDGKANHPVVYVSWYAAMAYAKWKGKRLPTEAEWEKAARGGVTDKRYVWGDSRDPSKANYGYYGRRTSPVGSYLPNGYGLYDMGGNVWEHCLDEFDKDFYRKSPKKNPIAGVSDIEALLENFTSVQREHVSRGGSWNTPGPAHVASRGSDTPINTNSWLGFRCASSIPPKQNAQTVTVPSIPD